MKNYSESALHFKKELDLIAEVGWQEARTTEYIRKSLLLKPSITGAKMMKTGVVVSIGRKTDPAIFLRADIDALPTQTGVKHICGHSTHTASLMAAYLWLQTQKEGYIQNRKRVVFIFQPAEETFPSGAKEMVKKYTPLLKKCSFGFGLHVSPDLKANSVGLRPGVVSAAGDYVEIEVRGKSTHIKALPKGIDAIESAAQIIILLKRFQTTIKGFGNRCVFNIDTIKGGTSPNRIADNVLMTGDVRWLDVSVGRRIKDFIESLPHLMKAKKYKTKVIVRYYNGYPQLLNNSALAREVSLHMEDNNVNIISSSPPSLGIEDFCYYTSKVPCLYANIGVGGKHQLHDDLFNVSERGVLNAYNYWIKILEWWLKK